MNERRQIRFRLVEDILKDVVSELILRQGNGILDEDLVELICLFFTGMIDTTLEDTTSVFMGGNLDTIRGNSIIDELLVSQRNEATRHLLIGRLKPIKTFLNNMISIQILRQVNDIRPQSLLNKLNLNN